MVKEFVPNGLEDAARDARILDRWFGGHDSCNMGIVTGLSTGIIAIETNPKTGGAETLKKFEVMFGKLPRTFRWHCGDGGECLVFKHPGGVVRDFYEKVGSGLRVRGDGGFVVTPPSKHISGNYYLVNDQYYPLSEAAGRFREMRVGYHLTEPLLRFGS